MRRSVVRLLVSSLLVAPGLTQDRVGRLGVFDAIDWRGVRAFEPGEVFDGLLADAEAVTIIHPTAPLSAYVDWLERRVLDGYRWAGFRRAAVDVRQDERGARIVIEVDEGIREIAAAFRLTVSPPNDELAAALSAALVSGDRECGALWQPGSAARFGPLVREGFALLLGSVCKDRGIWSAAIEIDWMDHPDGSVGLVVDVGKATPQSIESVRIEGVEPDEAERVLRHIDFRPGRLSTPSELRALARSLERTGRFREVRFPEFGPAGGADFDPLLIRVEPAFDLPAWDAMPWDDMRALELGLRAVAEELAGTAQLRLVSAAAEDVEGARYRARLSGTGIHAVVFDCRLGALRSGRTALSLDLSGGLQVSSAELGGLIEVPEFLEGDGRKALFKMALAPTSDPARPNVAAYGIGLVDSLDPDAPGVDVFVPLSPVAALGVRMHGAVLRSIVTTRRNPEAEAEDELVLRVGADPAAIRIDRSTGRVDFRADLGEARVDLVRGQVAPSSSHRSEVRDDLCAAAVATALRAALGDVDDEISPRLIEILALRVVPWGRSEISDVFASSPGSAQAGFYVPGWLPRTAAGAFLALLDRWGRALASSYPPETWPHAFARDLPGLVFSASARWQPFWDGMAMIGGRRACGPVGWLLLSEVAHLLDAAEASRGVAEWGLARCDFDAFWSDLVLLCPGGSTPERFVREVGRAWRDADLVDRNFDDLGAARAGARHLWDAGLGVALRARLEHWAALGPR